MSEQKEGAWERAERVTSPWRLTIGERDGEGLIYVVASGMERHAAQECAPLHVEIERLGLELARLRVATKPESEIAIFSDMGLDKLYRGDTLTP